MQNDSGTLFSQMLFETLKQHLICYLYEIIFVKLFCFAPCGRWCFCLTICSVSWSQCFSQQTQKGLVRFIQKYVCCRPVHTLYFDLNIWSTACGWIIAWCVASYRDVLLCFVLQSLGGMLRHEGSLQARERKVSGFRIQVLCVQ